MTSTLAGIRKKGDTGSNEEDELCPREKQFLIKYEDPTGKQHEGAITSRILNNDEKLNVARIAARLSGVAWANLPPTQAARLWALATISVQLRKPPVWFDKWVTEDDVFLFSVLHACEEHDSTFFRTGGGASKTDTAASRISIDTLTTSADPKV